MRIRRWFRRLVIVAGALVVLAAGLLFGFVWNERQRFLTIIAATDACDSGWRIDSLEKQRATIPDDENAALELLELKAKHGWVQVFARHEDDVTIFTDYPTNCVLNNSQRIQLASSFAGADTRRAEYRRIADLPGGRFPSAWMATNPNLRTNYNAAIQAAYFLHCDLLQLLDCGDRETALQSWRASITATRAFGDEPTLESISERYRIRLPTLFDAERMLAQTKWADHHLVAMQAELDTEPHPELLIQGLRGQRASLDRRFGFWLSIVEN